MPVPRLFEPAFDPREHWTHVLACVLELSGSETRAAFVAELAGETLEGTATMHVRERRQIGPDGPIVDISLRASDGGWTVGVVSSLAFGIDHGERLAQARTALAATAERAIVVAITPDRRPAGLGDGSDVRHRSWLRVRDWVQERPERGGASGVDRALLREADYFLNARVADLYRLEESAMPRTPGALRETLATAYFDLNDLAPSPRIETHASEVVIRYPRTGDASVILAVVAGGLEARVSGVAPAAGFDGDDARATLTVNAPDDYLAARAWTRAAARAVLPAPR